MCFRCSLWKVALFACFLGGPLPSWAQKDPNCGVPNDLLVVDTSGSMSEAGKIEALRMTIKSAAVQFKGQLRLGLISFAGSKAEVDVPLGLLCLPPPLSLWLEEEAPRTSSLQGKPKRSPFDFF